MKTTKTAFKVLAFSISMLLCLSVSAVAVSEDVTVVNYLEYPDAAVTEFSQATANDTDVTTYNMHTFFDVGGVCSATVRG